MSTALPFIPDAASIDDAVRDSLDIIAAVRENTAGLAINTARLDVMQADIVACRADALRAANAATVAVAKSDLVLKAIGELKLMVAQALGNGHASD